nr:immunoglobulin light chain junction region [Macaca mulatta]
DYYCSSYTSGSSFLF